jgi:hypothetical protein
MNAIDTSNQFEVVAGGETVCILKPPTRPLTKMESLRLAAWIVAVADPEQKVFPIMLQEITTK